MGIAIVTGASSGMGAEFVRELAGSGEYESIWLVARREERLHELASQLPLPARIIAADLSCDGGISAVKEALTAENPDVTMLVNAAGFGKYGTYKDLTDSEIDGIIDVNIRALVHVSYAVLPYMKKGAHIINLGSASVFQPLPEFNMYASSKVFVLHFSRALNVELKNRGITVTVLCPGYVNTEFFRVAQDTKNPDTCKNFSPMYECPYVVSRAIRAAKKGKDMCVPGLSVKLQRTAAKLLPHKWVMAVWMKIK